MTWLTKEQVALEMWRDTLTVVRLEQRLSRTTERHARRLIRLAIKRKDQKHAADMRLYNRFLES